MNQKLILLVMLISLMLLSSSFAATFAQMAGNKTCEACGMTVMADAQAQFKIKDENGTMHYAECLMCALMLLKTYDQLNITTFCDWYGPNATITINAKDHGEAVTCNDTTALFMNGGGCTKTRVAFNQTAVDALLANGYSSFTSTMLRTSLPANTTIMTIPAAAKLYGGGLPDPTPTPTPLPTAFPSLTAAPTQSQSPTATTTSTPTSNLIPTLTPLPTAVSTSDTLTTKACEACGMDVTPADQAKYTIIDGNGAAHYAECYMCALQLINKYDQLTITSYCDWYGPNYTITVQSQEFGKIVNVTPHTAMFLNGGSCVINRVAYNQTAADALLENGYSMYTLPEQHFDLPIGTSVTTVKAAALTFAKNDAKPTATGPILLAAFGGAAIIALTAVAYKKFKFNKD